MSWRLLALLLQAARSLLAVGVEVFGVSGLDVQLFRATKFLLLVGNLHSGGSFAEDREFVLSDFCTENSPAEQIDAAASATRVTPDFWAVLELSSAATHPPLHAGRKFVM